ncbi:class A beta-lactamase [Microlunatus speluncae]|uniref:class A beta-lactamase n=1 Tax=Microlunatus speluncae TaxID=2594267 RepID=UPI0012662C96|nr:class A beta-lactamase [Microlunatus speluncae]
MTQPAHPLPAHLSRRTLIAGAAGLGLALTLPAARAAATDKITELERRHDITIGLYARNLETGATLGHRTEERFPHCSVFKALAVATLLDDRRPHQRGILERGVHYAPKSLVDYSPFMQECLDRGITPTGADVCKATLQLSDNGAGNWVLSVIDGPAGATRFVRRLGDRVTRMDRWETELNSAVPGDPRDTSSPRAIADTFTRLIIGNALRPAERRRLTTWMLGNQTSDDRFRAGLPEGWRLADKTGGGAYGVSNDVGIAWTDRNVPVVIAAFTRSDREDAPTTDPAVVAELARISAATVVSDVTIR